MSGDHLEEKTEATPAVSESSSATSLSSVTSTTPEPSADEDWSPIPQGTTVPRKRPAPPPPPYGMKSKSPAKKVCSEETSAPCEPEQSKSVVEPSSTRAKARPSGGRSTRSTKSGKSRRAKAHQKVAAEECYEVEAILDHRQVSVADRRRPLAKEEHMRVLYIS